MWGNLGAFLERLDDEWNGSLKVSGMGVRQGLVVRDGQGLAAMVTQRGSAPTLSVTDAAVLHRQPARLDGGGKFQSACAIR